MQEFFPTIGLAGRYGSLMVFLGPGTQPVAHGLFRGMPPLLSVPGECLVALLAPLAGWLAAPGIPLSF